MYILEGLYFISTIVLGRYSTKVMLQDEEKVEACGMVCRNFLKPK